MPATTGFVDGSVLLWMSTSFGLGGYYESKFEQEHRTMRNVVRGPAPVIVAKLRLFWIMR